MLLQYDEIASQLPVFCGVGGGEGWGEGFVPPISINQHGLIQTPISIKVQ